MTAFILRAAEGSAPIRTVRIADTGETFECREDEPLLTALARVGRSAVRVGCRRGGCGVCKIRVLEGRYVTGKMSRAHVNASEERAGWVLACRAFPETDLVVEVPSHPEDGEPEPGAA